MGFSVLAFEGKIGFQAMAKKRKKQFDVVKAVKAAARTKVGSPPPTRKEDVAAKKRGKAEKHKVTIGQLLSED